MSKRAGRWPALLSLALGCAHTQAPAPAREPAPGPVEPARAPRGEQLARDARYLDLVRASSELEGTARTPAGCLLEQNASGFALRAELASALRPLPLPPRDLDETLKQAERVEILSAWGRYGDGSAKLALASFTTAPPAREALALLITDQGISVRAASGSGFAPLDGLDLVRTLATLDAQAGATLFVAAEADLPLHQLQHVLSALSARERNVALAVSLAPGTALPRPSSANARAPRCADGLPETDAPEGSLPMAALTAGVAPLKERAPDCLGRGDARGAAGGKLAVALRIAASGQVEQACIRRDELGDPGVAACVVELARGLRFTPPAPSGVIDLELPLTLVPSAASAQRAVCALTDS